MDFEIDDEPDGIAEERHAVPLPLRVKSDGRQTVLLAVLPGIVCNRRGFVVRPVEIETGRRQEDGNLPDVHAGIFRVVELELVGDDILRPQLVGPLDAEITVSRPPTAVTAHEPTVRPACRVKPGKFLDHPVEGRTHRSVGIGQEALQCVLVAVEDLVHRTRIPGEGTEILFILPRIRQRAEVREGISLLDSVDDTVGLDVVFGEIGAEDVRHTGGNPSLQAAHQRDLREVHRLDGQFVEQNLVAERVRPGGQANIVAGKRQHRLDVEFLKSLQFLPDGRHLHRTPEPKFADAGKILHSADDLADQRQVLTVGGEPVQPDRLNVVLVDSTPVFVGTSPFRTMPEGTGR